MSTDYNVIAQEYKKCKQQPWRQDIEQYTLTRLAGDLTGQSVLHLACGEGFQTRALKRNGAGRVVGVQLSERMIALAREEAARQPLRIHYFVGYASEAISPKPFDVVLAGHLLNYAQTRHELLAMCLAVARNLKPGGRFVTVTNNLAQPHEVFGLSQKYGFAKAAGGLLEETNPGRYRPYLEEGPFDIANYNLSVATHEWALRKAGFREVHWHQPCLSPEGEARWGRDYWREFLEHPPVIFIECVK
jgi:SAM-dependent methyltransferase